MLNDTSWYQLPVEEVFKDLRSENTGLASREAKTRLGKYGYNDLEVKKRGTLAWFLLQFRNPLLYILLGAAVVACLLSEFIDMWVITGAVLASVVFFASRNSPLVQNILSSAGGEN